METIVVAPTPFEGAPFSPLWRHFPRRDEALAKVEAELAPDSWLDLALHEPGGIARTRRQCVPHLLWRAGDQQLHFDPSLACCIFFDRHDSSPVRRSNRQGVVNERVIR